MAAAVSLGACAGSRPPGDLGGNEGRTVYLDGLRPDGRPPYGATPQRGAVDSVSYWDGSAASGPPSIRINLRDQKARFYKGDTLVGVSQISSGRESHPTPAGQYTILQKNADHVSNLYGVWKTADGTVINDDVDIRKQPTPPPGARFEGAPMPNFMRLTNTGVGMHAGYLPGFPASHGCIRMPEFMSQHFFDNVSLGTPVTVE